MKCPTADNLSQYFDGILSEEQAQLIEEHVKNCASCQQVVQLYKDEEQFIHDTLETPTLPDSFEAEVLAQLTPYKKRKSRLWNKGVAAAATLLLAGGIAVSVTPSFANFVQSLFASPTMDSGLHTAVESGIVVPVNLEVTDGNRTLYIEDTLVDTSRIAFTYRVIKGNGKYGDPYFEPSGERRFVFKDAEGNELPQIGMESWSRVDEQFGMYSFDLPLDFEHDQIFLSFNVEKIGFKSGNWNVEIPFDLTAAREQTKIYAQEATHIVDGVALELHDLQFTVSQTSLDYTTKFTEEEFKNITTAREKIAETYGRSPFERTPVLHFAFENSAGKEVASSSSFGEQALGSQGKWIEDHTGMRNIQRFAPLQEAGNLTFVLKGIYKPRPVEIAAPLKEGETFEVEGYELKIENVEAVKKKGDRYIEAKLVGQTPPELLNEATWRATAGGKALDAFMSGLTDEPIDGSDLVNVEIYVRVHGLKKIPEDFTIAITELIDYKPLEQPWRMPLMD